MIEGPRRSLGQTIRAFFRNLDHYSPVEVFGRLLRPAAMLFGKLFRGRTRALTDPFALSIVAGGVLVAGGLILIGLAWRGASTTLLVSVQVAYLVSGGLGGLSLVWIGLVVLHIQGSRWLAANERALMQRVRQGAVLVEEAAAIHQRGDGS